MNKNLDLTKILKDCPQGTKFYSRCLGSVEFCKITLDNYIEVIGKNGYYIGFKPNGIYQHSEENAEIDLFPSKDQRDWSKWHRPFVDGDIVFYNDIIALFKEWGDETLFRTYVAKGLNCEDLIGINTPLFGKGVRNEIRFATEEEKQKLFKALEDNGYKWNAEEKKLEKLIIPKFKVGDKIRHRLTGAVYMVLFVLSNGDGGGVYDVAVTNEIGKSIDIEEQDNYELLPNKFDPKTLQPFDKVLTRDLEEQSWDACIYSHMNEYEYEYYPFTASLIKWRYCIPYNDDTKHLIGKTDEAPEFYRYWEK